MGRSIAVRWTDEGVREIAHAITDNQGHFIIAARDGQRFVSKCVHELLTYSAPSGYGLRNYYLISRACKHDIVFAERGTPLELIKKLLEDGSI